MTDAIPEIVPAKLPKGGNRALYIVAGILIGAALLYIIAHYSERDEPEGAPQE